MEFAAAGIGKKIGFALLTTQQVDVLVMKVLQGQDDKVVIRQLAYLGKKQLETELRAAVSLLYRALCNEGYSSNEY